MDERWQMSVLREQLIRQLAAALGVGVGVERTAPAP